jgi:zinc protease
MEPSGDSASDHCPICCMDANLKKKTLMKSLRTFYITLQIILLLFSLPAHVAGQGTSLKNDASVKTGRLANGFQYYIRYNKEPEGRATIYLANRVGSMLESDSEQGIAHFIEHMNFNGTKHFPKHELISYLEKSGIKFGADLNAYTSYNETVYQLPLPTNDKDLWNNGLLIMRDWANSATLDEDEFEKERGVIMAEKRLKNNANGRLAEKYRPMLYNYSKYAERTPIGKDDVINHANVSLAKSFYQKWYRPDLQSIIIVGDIDVEEVEKQTIKLFSDLQGPKNPPKAEMAEVPLIDSSRFLQVTDPELTGYGVQWYAKVKSRPLKTSEDFKNELKQQLANILCANRFQEINNKTSTPYVSASASIGNLIANIDVLEMRVRLNPDNTDAGIKAYYTEITQIKRFGFNNTELDQAKNRIRQAMQTTMVEKDKISSGQYADAYLQHFLTGSVYLSEEDKDLLVKRYLDGITTDEINLFLAQYFNSKDQSIIVMGPEQAKSKLPGADHLAALLKAAEANVNKAYQSEADHSTLQSDRIIPGKIIREEAIEKIGVIHWTFANGVNVFVKPTNFRNDEVLFTAFSDGGTSIYSDKDFFSAKNSAAFVTASGVGNLSANQLKNIMSRQQFQVNPFITDRSQGFSGASSVKGLPDALALVNLYFTSPKLDTTKFSAIINQSKSAFKNRVSDPQNDFTDTITYVLSGYHTRRKPVSFQDLENLDSSRILSIFKDRFSNARGLTFIFTGNINTDSLKIWTSKYLGSLPDKGISESARDLGIRVPKGKLAKDVLSGSGDKASVNMLLSGKYKYGKSANLYLNLYKFTLGLRLMSRLREKEGGVYAPGVYTSQSKTPINFYSITVAFECEPSRVKALIEATREEINKLLAEGVTTEEIQKFVAEESRAHELNLKSNAFWLGELKTNLTDGESLNGDTDYVATLRKINIKESKKYGALFLNQKNEIVFTLSPKK